MEGELIKVESKSVNELEGEFAETEKAIQRFREKLAVDILKKRLQLQSEEDGDDRKPEVKMGILERKAEEIIPKECWGLVLHYLDKEDLLSCRRVCKTFRQLLDLNEFKVKWKFPAVLTLVFPYLRTSEAGIDPWKHLHNVRLVSRSWRYWIDKYASDVHGTGLQSFLPLTTAMPLVTRFETSGVIEKFQRTFGEYEGNPFPSKSVYIGTPNQDRVEDHDVRKRLEDVYIEKVGELLEQFGKHISRLELCFTEQMLGPDNLTWCKLLKRISIHLPNLRDLFIYNEPHEEEDDDEEDEEDDEEDDEELASYIAENALAPLPNLLSLSFCGLDKRVDEYLLDAFGPQLTQFGTSYPLNLPTPFQMQQLRNVRKLWLPLFEPQDTLEALRVLQSPLELLELTCLFGLSKEMYGLPLKTFNVDKVLRDLKHLPIQVLELNLCLLGRMNLAEAGIEMKEFTNSTIKTLVIHIDRQWAHEYHTISFNFLQALKKLENLEVKFSGERLRITHPEELPEVVKLNKYLMGEKGTGRIYHSNVWEKVPSLKTFTLTREKEVDQYAKSIYTRKKYERIIAKGDGRVHSDLCCCAIA